MLRLFLVSVFMSASLMQLGAQNAHLTHLPKRTKGVADSSFVYELPFAFGEQHYLIQGYNGIWSHQGDHALDFTMKQGTPVLAARSGIVTEIKEDGEKHGFKGPAAYDGNYIEIRHSDGTYAGYWHLQKNGVLVEVGDTVSTGQQIGLSGHTGFSSMPHLHFYVYGYDANGHYTTFPTRFRFPKGAQYLRPSRHYYHHGIPFLLISPDCGGSGRMSDVGVQEK